MLKVNDWHYYKTALVSIAVRKRYYKCHCYKWRNIWRKCKARRAAPAKAKPSPGNEPDVPPYYSLHLNKIVAAHMIFLFTPAVYIQQALLF